MATQCERPCSARLCRSIAVAGESELASHDTERVAKCARRYRELPCQLTPWARCLPAAWAFTGRDWQHWHHCAADADDSILDTGGSLLLARRTTPAATNIRSSPFRSCDFRLVPIRNRLSKSEGPCSLRDGVGTALHGPRCQSSGVLRGRRPVDRNRDLPRVSAGERANVARCRGGLRVASDRAEKRRLGV